MDRDDLATLRQIASELNLRGDQQIKMATALNVIIAKYSGDEDVADVANWTTPTAPVDGIGTLAVGDEGIELDAIIDRMDAPKAYPLADGEEGHYQWIYLSDATGKIKLTLWNEQITKYEDLKAGDEVHVEAWRVKEGYKGKGKELDLGRQGKLVKRDHNQEALEDAN